MVCAPWPDPVSHSKLFGSAISEVYDNSVEKNGVACYAQLNVVKDAITTGDLDPVMIPSAVNLCIP